MRDRAQLELKPREWQDAGRADRQRLLAQLKAVLRSARERREEWYVWVLQLRERRLAGLYPLPPAEPEAEASLLSDDLTFE